jgi:hypothetical protein
VDTLRIAERKLIEYERDDLATEVREIRARVMLGR